MPHLPSQSPRPKFPLAVMPLLRDNGYTLEEILGSGSDGNVVQAHSRKRNEKVAIEVCSKKKCSTWTQLFKIKREAMLMKTLKGKPDIIELYEVLTNENCMLIIREVAERGDLFSSMGPGLKLPENWARSFFKDLITGLKDCHEKNIIHGDIKCENCLVDKEGTLKLADSGFAAPQYGYQLGVHQ